MRLAPSDARKSLFFFFFFFRMRMLIYPRDSMPSCLDGGKMMSHWDSGVSFLVARALQSSGKALSCKGQSILLHPTSPPFPASRSITAIDYSRAGKQMPKYINQSPRWQRDFIKTITPSSVFLPTPASSAQWPFLLEGFQELCRHDLMAGGISSIWGKFRP